MSKAHYLVPTGPRLDPITVRLGAGTGSSNNYSTADEGKLVKLTAESRYELCVAGDKIEGAILAVESATSGGYSIGGVETEEIMFAVADGLEATAGTGTLAIGDFVVAGTITAKGTALTSYPKVCKATNQPGATVAVGTAGADTAAAIKVVTDAALVKVIDQLMVATKGFRVVSLGTVGTGAVGTTVVIAPVQ